MYRVETTDGEYLLETATLEILGRILGLHADGYKRVLRETEENDKNESRVWSGYRETSAWSFGKKITTVVIRKVA